MAAYSPQLPSSLPNMKPWPWEGSVQEIFASMLVRHGWKIESLADTARKARGVDVLATREDRLLGAEVKGYPSTNYADPARAHETKKARPSTQARHWYAEGVLAALLLLESQPDRESLLVLPDNLRYQGLRDSTRTGLAGAGVHVLLVDEDGSYDCTTWNAGS